MKNVWIALLLMIGTKAAYGNIAIATFATSYKQKIQVLINDKVVNDAPKEVVKLRTPAGIHNLKIKIFDVCGEVMDVFEDNVVTGAGTSVDFELDYYDACELFLRRTGIGLIHGEVLKRPEKLFNSRNIALSYPPGLPPDRPRIWAGLAG